MTQILHIEALNTWITIKQKNIIYREKIYVNLCVWAAV